MNWFRNHLNLTYGIVGAVLFIMDIFLGAMEFAVGSVIIIVLSLSGLIWLSVLVLKNKKRPLWIAILAPFFLGWLYILCCPSRNEALLAQQDENLGDIKLNESFFKDKG